ncbi:MAG: 50S ribosomal protein L10 [Acidimicrobiales bacterium]
MDNPRAEKVAVVDEVRQHLGAADAVILTEYRGLKVKDLAALRRSLRPAGAEYRIYKNTLVRFAARDAGLTGLEPMLEGPTAIAFVNGDAAAVAKALRDFGRTNPLLVIKGGVLGAKVIGPAEAAALAELPSREVLLAQFAGALAAPMRQLAGLFQALPRNLAYGLKALLDLRTAGEAPAPAVLEDPAGEAPAPAVLEDPAGEAPAPAALEDPAGEEPTGPPGSVEPLVGDNSETTPIPSNEPTQE